MNPAPFCLIGIVNVTPDSFSDGGKYIDPRNAVAHGLRLLDEGAGMLDLGAESTRPFAEPVPEGEEIARLMPVVARLREQRPDAVLSVDTLKAGTARAALEGGADIINDVSACVADPALLDVLAEYKPGYVLMHSQGSPREMQVNPRYGNVVEEILAFFEEHLARLVKAGLPEDRIVLDPGIGFGKNKDHTVAILKGLERFASLGRPLYVGLSRKSMFREILGLELEQRAEATRLDFLSFYWRDVLDIALVTLLLYRILLLIRGTRAFSALIGLVVLVAVYALSHFIGLYSLSWLLENLFGSLFLVIVILFHDDIRQALAAMGTQYLSWKKRPAPSNMVGDLVWVCQYFAKRRIGALIVLEGKVQLGDMMKGGVVLDARISRELLLTIFFPNTALHDGAVIIRKGRIAAAGCILPLAQMDRQNFGTRHRAALGATEVSDATVIVVSEERGEVSVASKGHLAVMPDAEQLKETLNNVIEH